ncbi:hypothetical protein QEG98_01505 [Myxococcus sp. MxC21-1]|nr:hypothetical protein [Myxococcus sp. MxC21-1]WNZ62550.1 hypothetical protein QEG98_01505 [Myxococcus sp. MxC21-1]
MRSTVINACAERMPYLRNGHPTPNERAARMASDDAQSSSAHAKDRG